MVSSLYTPQRIMEVVFIILDWIFVLMNVTTTISKYPEGIGNCIPLTECVTLVPELTTFSLSVEMNRSTSVVGWSSPSGTCQTKPNELLMKRIN